MNDDQGEQIKLQTDWVDIDVAKGVLCNENHKNVKQVLISKLQFMLIWVIYDISLHTLSVELNATISMFSEKHTYTHTHPPVCVSLPLSMPSISMFCVYFDVLAKGNRSETTRRIYLYFHFNSVFECFFKLLYAKSKFFSTILVIAFTC